MSIQKIDDTNDITYLTQSGLKSYIKNKFDIELFREPDEAYLFRTDDTYILKILEKKNQNGSGSVDLKLCLDKYYCEEYKECLGEAFEIQYAFCLSEYLKKEYTSYTKKYEILRNAHKRNNTTVLFGDDPDYFTLLDKWLY